MEVKGKSKAVSRNWNLILIVILMPVYQNEENDLKCIIFQKPDARSGNGE